MTSSIEAIATMNKAEEVVAALRDPRWRRVMQPIHTVLSSSSVLLECGHIEKLPQKPHYDQMYFDCKACV